MNLSLARAALSATLMMAALAVGAQPTNFDMNSFKIIADRNIFNQSRLPHERGARPMHVADSFSFVGALFYTGGNIAFFNGTSGEYRRALEVGGDIAGFKVVAVTLNSVTLSDGTNQILLTVTSQMRRDDAGHWSLFNDRANYAGNAAGSNAERFSGRSRRFNMNRRDFTTITRSPTGNEGMDTASSVGSVEPPPSETETSPPAGSAPGGANDALSRLMQRRAQEEQQIGQ